MGRFFHLVAVFPAVLALSLMSGCDRSGSDGTAAVSPVLEVVQDSLSSSVPGEICAVVEFPADTSSLLSRAIGEYIAETLGGSWEGSCADVDGMLKAYVDGLSSAYSGMFSGLPADEVSCFDKLTIVKYAENDKFVTFVTSREMYLGGAHGSLLTGGMTFRKADGRRIGWDVFTGKYDENFAGLVKDGLKKYWNISSDEELRSCFLDENDYYSIPLPECPPLFTPEGIEFVYNEYEIAAYAYGRPTFTIPYSEISDYMMVTARRLL